MDNALFAALTEVERKDLAEFFSQKVKELEEQVIRYKNYLVDLGYNKEPVNVTAPHNVVKPGQQSFPENLLPPPVKEYRSTWSWSQKIKHVLATTGYCLTSREIVEKIQELEPGIPETIINSVSGSISNKISKKVLFNRYRPYEGADNYIGLRDWFTENDELIEQYRGDE